MKNKLLLAVVLVTSCILILGTLCASAKISGYYRYTKDKGQSTITGCDTSASGDLVIPSTLGGYPVTTISDCAFSSCKNLTSITIPNSVTSIGNEAFSSCENLISITIPDSVVSIGNLAFHYCHSLTSITIPDSVTSIANWTFSGCSSLSSITIPDSVISIGDWVFYGCDSLTSITIPNSVTSIGERMFGDCDNLSSITIPDSVISIGDKAFVSCDSLTSIIIPNSVTSIGDGAFSDCNSLTDVYYNGTKEDWDLIKIGVSNEPLINAMTKMPENEGATMNISDKKDSITVMPEAVDINNTFLLALYKNNRLVAIQTKVFTGEELVFTTDKEFTSAKVMTWDSLSNLKAVCSATTE